MSTNIRLKSIAPGKTFTVNGREFILCEHLAHGESVAVLKDVLSRNERFGDNNNYDGSHLDDVCNTFANEMENAVGDSLCEFELDLTADDGMKQYGTVFRKAAPLTANMYRRYAYELEPYKPSCWWWLCTAYSTPEHSDSTWIKCVSPRGGIYHDWYDFEYGVRPFCILGSSILVSRGG